MTFLELVKELQMKAGIAGPAIVTTVGQTNMSLRLVNWIAQAWQEIQTMRNDWNFMTVETNKLLTIGVNEYNLQTDWGIANLRKFDPDDWRIEDPSLTNDKSYLRVWPYARWRERYGANITNSAARPSELTYYYPAGILKVRFNALPDIAYRVTFSYKTNAITLAADGDIPNCPVEYHMLIVWRALGMYGYFESAPELIAQANQEFSAMYRNMVSTQTPSEFEVLPCPIA